MSRPGTIGLVCPPDHPVFSTVGELLAATGYEVAFFDPAEPVAPDRLADLSLFAAKTTRPASLRALRTADGLGVPTWNSPTGVGACASRFSQLCLLEGVGFSVPAASRTKPPGEYVAKSLYHWGDPPTLNGDGDLYEELLVADPVDYKYYLVDDGETVRTAVVRATSKLWGQKRVLGAGEPVATHVERIESLMTKLGMRTLGVDLVRTDDGWYAVDVNPCPGFAGTGLERELADSMRACLVDES